MSIYGDVPKFSGPDTLIPVVVQDAKTSEVLMLAYMNEEAWKITQRTLRATFWSRSRKKLWTKGETSGNYQIVKEIRLDCDADAILLKVEQLGGAACHTGYRSCFHRKWNGERWVIEEEKVFDPEKVYGQDSESK
ncbi:MAG: phosphoribosyl-AMP cyclohydrolase [Syntrophales bacterium]|nr:phosphoribosyl-AMP cyclohydrolase [Syntrophales bacterium]